MPTLLQMLSQRVVNNTPIFIQKVTNELRKLPDDQAERVCKSLIVLLKEMK